MTPKESSQKKTAAIRARLKFANEQAFVEKYALNVDKYGIFIKTPKPRAVGTRIKFEFQIADGSPVLRGLGDVVWARSEAEDKRPPGMGIKFLKLDAKSQKIVERIAVHRSETPALAKHPSKYAEGLDSPAAEETDEAVTSGVSEPTADQEKTPSPAEIREPAESEQVSTEKASSAREKRTTDTPGPADTSRRSSPGKRRRRTQKGPVSKSLNLDDIDSMLAEIGGDSGAERKRGAKRRSRGRISERPQSPVSQELSQPENLDALLAEAAPAEEASLPPAEESPAEESPAEETSAEESLAEETSAEAAESSATGAEEVTEDQDGETEPDVLASEAVLRAAEEDLSSDEHSKAAEVGPGLLEEISDEEETAAGDGVMDRTLAAAAQAEDEAPETGPLPDGIAETAPQLEGESVPEAPSDDATSEGMNLEAVLDRAVEDTTSPAEASQPDEISREQDAENLGYAVESELIGDDFGDLDDFPTLEAEPLEGDERLSLDDVEELDLEALEEIEAIPISDADVASPATDLAGTTAPTPDAESPTAAATEDFNDELEIIPMDEELTGNVARLSRLLAAEMGDTNLDDILDSGFHDAKFDSLGDSIPPPPQGQIAIDGGGGQGEPAGQGEPLLENDILDDALDDIFDDVEGPTKHDRGDGNFRYNSEIPETLPDDAIPEGLMAPNKVSRAESPNALYESVAPPPADAEVPVPEAEPSVERKEVKKKGFFKKLFG